MDELLSRNGRFRLQVQSDGNLVLYDRADPIWASDTVRPPEPAPPVPVLAPLTVRGRFFYAGESVYRWRGVTAFALLAQIAQGREADAAAYLDWAQARGFSLVRVLAMCEWLGLSPQQGRDAWPRLLAMLTARGLRAEVVALADTRAFGFDEDAVVPQLQWWGDATRRTPHTLAGANEPWHPTQSECVNDIEWIQNKCLQYGDIVTVGAPQDDEDDLPDRGSYLTRHLDRGRDLWNMVRRVRELEALSAETGKPVVNGEPIGAGPQDEPGRRYTDPAIAYTFGVLMRIFEVGTTFHLEAGLRCTPPSAVEDACAQAFIRGSRITNDDERMAFQNATWASSPVKSFDAGAAVRVYSGLVDDYHGYTCALGLTGDPQIEWQHNWRITDLVGEMPGVKVWRILR